MQHLAIIINITEGFFCNSERNYSREFTDLGRTRLALAASQCHPCLAACQGAPHEGKASCRRDECLVNACATLHNSPRRTKPLQECVVTSWNYCRENVLHYPSARGGLVLISAQHLIRLPLELGGLGSHLDKCKWLKSHVH